MRLPHIQTTEGVDVAFIGIPFDTAGSYRTGQRMGPAAIRNASVMCRAHNPFQQVTIFDHISGVDYGDLPVAPGNIEETYRLIQESLSPMREAASFRTFGLRRPLRRRISLRRPRC